MKRENYQKVVEMMGYECLYHKLTGFCGEGSSLTKVDVDNSEGKATEVLERIISYADALLYDADRWEEDELTDWFNFIIDGEHYELDIDYMIHDEEEADWEKWEALKERILKAKRIGIEYSFAADTISESHHVEEGLWCLLKDVLAEGRLADCVSLCTCTKSGIRCADDGLGLVARRAMWMNGMHNGQYVCGEIPFESNEDAIRRCSGWKEADEGDIEDGLMLKLHPKTSTALLKRVREVAKSFEQKIDCEMKLMMSYNDFRNDYIEQHAAMEDGTVSCVDKAEDDRQQRNFPDLRVYFTPEEKQMVRLRKNNTQSKMIGQAISKT